MATTVGAGQALLDYLLEEVPVYSRASMVRRGRKLRYDCRVIRGENGFLSDRIERNPNVAERRGAMASMFFFFFSCCRITIVVNKGGFGFVCLFLAVYTNKTGHKRCQSCVEKEDKSFEIFIAE